MLAKRMIDTYYLEAMVLADEVRSYFDTHSEDGDACLDAVDRIIFCCESLKVTTRLMQVIAWLLTQRARELSGLPLDDSDERSQHLGHAVDTDATTLARMPASAQQLISASCDLYRKVERFGAGLVSTAPPVSPARFLHDRLSRAF